MRDIDVRRALLCGELQRFKGDGASRIVEELSLCQGDARIDIAVVNGKLHGFEIKSEKDTLERLSNQITVYSKVFDHLTLVVGKVHLEKSLQILPEWWGVSSVEDNNGRLRIKKVRKPKQNKNVDAFSVVQLLWRDECVELLTNIGKTKGINSKPRSWLWARLVHEIEPRALCKYVRETIKCRTQWRAGADKQRTHSQGSKAATYIGPLIVTL